MFKWLLLLAAGLYGAFLIGGADRGQMRAGLRDQPEPTEPAVQVVSAAPAPSQDAVITTVAATALVPMMPRQTLRVMPPPTDMPTLPVAAQTDSPAEPGNTTRWIAVDRANVRAEARKGADVTGRVERGEAVRVLWTEPSGWARVRIEGDGVDGFVHESLLTDADPQLQ